jgi:hypothetical protein
MKSPVKMNAAHKALLGNGTNITGRQVEYWGSVWTITGKNYLGDWEVERREHRPTGGVKVASSVDAFVLPEEHPHHARLMPTN